MKRSPLLEIAHQALQNPCRYTINFLLDSVNLTPREREVIVKSEIGKEDLETICNNFISWNRKTICSYSHMVKIKKDGMLKIGNYLNNNKTTKK